MLDSLTRKNKKDLFIYIAFSIIISGLFSLLAYYSYNSLIYYKNSTVSPFYNSTSDPIKTSATSMTRQLILIIIDGLSYQDSGRLSSLNEFKNKSVYSKIEILPPTLSITSWMTYMTGAPPEVHGFISPAGDKLKYAPCENILSSAKSRTFKTAVFGHEDWKKAFDEYADISYYAQFNGNNTNIIEIDSHIMSNAISHIRHQKPEFAIIHLPGLDKTSHMFGREGHEFKVHLQKLDDILKTFLNSSLVNGRYVIITSDHGHIRKGGHGGGEPVVTGVPFMLAGPEVINQNIKFMQINQTDICPTICSLLGIPVPFLNNGSFLNRLFSFEDYIKILKMKAILAQKSLYYRTYLKSCGIATPEIFNYEPYAAEIEKNAGTNFNQTLIKLETYEKTIDIEFKKLIDDNKAYKKLFRLFYLGFILTAFLSFLIYKFKNKFRFFAVLAQIIIFYSIYYGIYFFHGFNFSLSDFNSFEHFNSFMDKRRIEAVCALLLSYTPLMLNYFLMHKRLYTWLNYVFFPVFIEFNFYLSFSLAAQCAYYIFNFGPAIKNSLPDMSSALKYYFDIQILIVTQCASLLMALAAYFLLAAAAGKKTRAFIFILILSCVSLNTACATAEDNIMRRDIGECTLAGACGYNAMGGGSIVLKNRDRNTRFIQSLDFVKEDGGYFFIGVKNREERSKDSLAYTMGINEKGFICVSSSPPNKINFDFRKRKYQVYHPGKILSQIATVDEFIQKILKTGRLGSAMNYIAADSKKMCLVEVINEMHYEYKIIINGVVCQTNHYHFDKMKPYQGSPINKSSAARLERAVKLSDACSKILAVKDFMAMAADHGENDEYNDFNICRHPDSDYGSPKFDGGTISSMILISRGNEPPCAFVAMGQPCATVYEKFTIINGACDITPLNKYLYRSGAINIINDFKRDAYYHFLKPFIDRKNPDALNLKMISTGGDK